MDYTNLNEESSNCAKVSGMITSVPVKSHQIEGENFYEFEVEVERLSKIKDKVPVTISERLLSGAKLNVGDFVRLSGEYRSYNKIQNEKSRLILHFFVKEFEMGNVDEYKNEVTLLGYICKDPIYRKTPFEREICDVLLAVNRPNYHKSDYIPCIMWGRNARFIGNQNVGCKVEISGRIQSREYAKTDDEGNTVIKTAYEVSCQKINLLSNVANMTTKKEDENTRIV